ncbi:MAG: HNH endonuclease [Candidatus Saccharimonas sp.]|nr:HNH endonuclease [Planctomycetaceae bacterium]
MLDWLKRGWTKFVDPEREKRLDEAVSRVHGELKRQLKEFKFSVIADKYDIEEDDRPVVAERVYQRCVERAWSDDELSDKEAKSLSWIATCLEIPAASKQRLHEDVASSVLGRVFDRAMVDGTIDSSEAAQLASIAKFCGQTVPQMMKHFFSREGEMFLRSAFAQMTHDGRIDQAEWQAFCGTVNNLGVDWSQLKQMIDTPARQFVEHVLADVKSDGSVSKEEEDWVVWLLDHCVADELFSDYVRAELQATKRLDEISKGRLPSLPSPRDVELRAGEIVHFVGRANYALTKQLASGPRTDEFTGVVVVTDNRMMFVSGEKSFQVSHRKIMGHRSSRPSRITILSEGRGAGEYTFGGQDNLAVPIWKAAIGRANQTIVEDRADPTSRHITREVRQRVWQKYGGRCAECSADQYLEFDHIVPVAKGGSNGDNNVQLLCRKCNLTKSDNI